jgi:ADP-ribosyl-[dinitrogen reductase] hydrolase
MSAEVATRRYHETTLRSGGNGSLMRIAPLAALSDLEQATRAAQIDSHLTHYDPIAAEACVWLISWLQRLLDNNETIPPASAAVFEAINWSDEQVGAEVNGQRAGYVLVALAVAVHDALAAESFEQGLITVVNRGGDADTNGAIAGAILGARFGAEAIPARWLKLLLERDEITELAAKLQTL